MDQPRRLSNSESEELVVVLAQLSESQMPIAPGLKAAAQECTSRRVARALKFIAREVESGATIEKVMDERSDFLPAHVRGLIVAAARTNRLAVALDQLVEHHRVTRETQRRIISALAYPMIVLFAALLFMFAIPLLIVPQFKLVFDEFELEVPKATKSLIAVSDQLRWLLTEPGIWVTLCFLAIPAILVIVARVRMGREWRKYFATTIPFVGSILQSNGAAAFARLMATLLEFEIPLPEALRLAQDGLPDPSSRGVARYLAQGTAEGRCMSDLLFHSRQMPESVVPFIRWGEKAGQLPQALRTVNDLLLLRATTRASVLGSIAPPFLFIFIAFVVGATVVALFLPMMGLIQGLS